MSFPARLLGAALLAAALSCASRDAAILREESARAQVTNRVIATLDRQKHYFSSEPGREAFLKRLKGIAHATGDARTFYRGIADALAALSEGHTGLVGSAQVPFSITIPPVAVLEVEGQPVVAGVAPGIEGGGLRAGDLILAVDHLPANRVLARRLKTAPGSTEHARRARAVANILAGPTNSPALVKVRGADGRIRKCYPVRFLLDDEGIDRMRFGFLPTGVDAVRVSPAAAYVALPEFDETRRRELEQALRPLSGMPVLVLDLRGNPGGSIRILQRVAGIFFERPRDFMRMRKDGEEEVLRTIPGPLAYPGTLRILVDERTGSAAELLAGSLQQLGRAKVIGRPTAGSARARRSISLPGGVVFHYAGRAEFFLNDGTRVEGVGVEPDLTYRPARTDLASGAYGDPFRDPAVRLALRQD